MCRYVLKNGLECRKPASIDGLCVTHYRIENKFNDDKMPITIYITLGFER